MKEKSQIEKKAEEKQTELLLSLIHISRDVAIRCFEAEMNREINDMRMGR